ncbi:hypothetical protein NM208_g12642 [Fusarium decemcellulare]|uniref:Uncharacterized protein n=1 Tax=Fusarium decemcellulare TaxID=57161 RepID=A0ACC1RQE5_9HYPO|nr:hypothetical protein NM208_g12642 [Fusarium decemcellulare]
MKVAQEPGRAVLDNISHNTLHATLSTCATVSEDETLEEKSLSSKLGSAAYTILLLSAYSTSMSGLWLAAALVQPRWGHLISSTHGISPSTAAMLSALLSPNPPRAGRETNGITLGEMTMRSWIIQPGSVFTHWHIVPLTGRTYLGILSLAALVATTFYTTASEALVSPKLKFGGWENLQLNATVDTKYGNFLYAATKCPQLFGPAPERESRPELEEWAVTKAKRSFILELNYKGTRDLFTFISQWHQLSDDDNNLGANSLKRPAGNTLLDDNITIASTQVETKHQNVTAHYNQWGRIVDNFTLSIPHPSVWDALLLPRKKGEGGGLTARAGVVSPSLNVLCVNMAKEELEPLIYETWPHSKHDGFLNWTQNEMDADWVFRNRTAVDEIFGWKFNLDQGQPVFYSYPEHNNFAVAPLESSKASFLTKAANFDNYTLCEARSWLSTDCSTHIDISSGQQPFMYAHCEDTNDEDRYEASLDQHPIKPQDSKRWVELAVLWCLSVGIQPMSFLDTSLQNATSNSGMILAELVLRTPSLPSSRPTLAEAFSASMLSTLVSSARGAQVRHTWDHGKPDMPLGIDWELDVEEYLYRFNKTETFDVSIASQEYTSGHTSKWQGIFFIVLVVIFAINLICLGYLIFQCGIVTDFTEPQNHFSLAISSPSSKKMSGSCSDGPQKEHLSIPWRISRASAGSDHIFEDVDRGSHIEHCEEGDRRSLGGTKNKITSLYKRLQVGVRRQLS